MVRNVHAGRRAGAARAAAAAVAAAAALAGCVRAPGDLGRFETVAVVNGEPVAYGELLHHMRAVSSEVFTQFHERCRAEDSPAFWTTPCDGRTPVDVARKRALAACVRDKVQQIAARKNGLLKRIDYRSLLAAMETVNRERERAVAKGAVVYGPVTFDEPRYYDQIMGEIARDLKAALGPAMAISGEQIARYYDEHKERFRLGAEKRMKAITAALTGRKRSDSAARSALRKVSRRLAAGASFESVYDSLWRKPGGPLSATEITFGPHAQPRTFDLGNPQLAGEIARTSPGQVTGIIEENGSAGIYYCVEVRDLVYMSIEQADPGIRRDIIDRRYAELVDRWVGQARVKVVKRNMARAAMKQGG